MDKARWKEKFFREREREYAVNQSVCFTERTLSF